MIPHELYTGYSNILSISYIIYLNQTNLSIPAFALTPAQRLYRRRCKSSFNPYESNKLNTKYYIPYIIRINTHGQKFIDGRYKDMTMKIIMVKQQ